MTFLRGFWAWLFPKPDVSLFGGDFEDELDAFEDDFKEGQR